MKSKNLMQHTERATSRSDKCAGTPPYHFQYFPNEKAAARDVPNKQTNVIITSSANTLFYFIF